MTSRGFDAWSDTVDSSSRRSSESVGPALAASGSLLVVVAVAGVLPYTRDSFQLRAGTAFLCAAPFVMQTLVYCMLSRVAALPHSIWLGHVLSSSALLVFWGGSLVVLSSPPGSRVLAAIPILSCAYLGYVLRAAPRNPVGWLALTAGLAASALLPTEQDLSSLLPVVGLGMPAAWSLGSLGLRRHRRERQRAALRSAVEAQILQGHDRDRGRLSDAILRILQRNHDASNALSTALVNAELLSLEHQRRRTDEPNPSNELDARDELEPLLEANGDIHHSLTRLKVLLDETRTIGQSQTPSHEGIANAPIVSALQSVLALEARRFPRSQFGYDLVEGTSPKVTARVSDGYPGLHRILEELVQNACEGNGASSATRVDVLIREQSNADTVYVQVVDNGPGFTTDQLALPITGFQSTKAGSVGLGLYTAEKLVRASGGSVHRDNLPGGGAVVSVSLQSSAPTHPGSPARNLQ